MAKKSKRMTREELRQPDEVQVALKGMWDWIEAHWKTLAAGGVALVLAGGASTMAGDMANESQQEEADALSLAIAPLTAPVGDSPIGATEDADEERFQDRKTAVAEAAKRLKGFAGERPEAAASGASKMLLASLPEGNTDALRGWLGENGDSQLKMSALHALAESQIRSGDRDGAIATYTELAEASIAGGTKAIALVALGDLHNPLVHGDAGDATKARDAYTNAAKALGPRPIAAPGDIYASLSEPYLYAEIDARLALIGE